MAIELGATYPGQSDVTVNDPTGNFKNSTFVGAFDGTPGDKQWARDMWSFLARMLVEASVVPNGVADSQVFSQIFDAFQILVRTVTPKYYNLYTDEIGDSAKGSDNQIYRSLTAANTGNNPVPAPAPDWALDSVIEIVNDLLSVDPTAALSAAQGPEITGLIPVKSDIGENIAGINDTKFVSPLGIRESVNSTGLAPIFALRAWVNFDGTGVVFIRGAGNVSSITDNGLADYTVNFGTVLPNANYGVVILIYNSGSTDNFFLIGTPITKTAAGFRFRVGARAGAGNAAAAFTDAPEINVMITG